MAHKLKPSNVMLAALVGGFGAGFVPVQQAFANAGLRPGIGTAIAVNAILPLVAVALGIFSRKVWPMIPAGILISLGFFLGAMARVEPRFWVWTASLAARVGHPILIAAAVGCALIGLAAAALAAGNGQHTQRPAV